ncbi:MAG: hypothetical protein D6730_01910, partial [Bacteroidetes bacterium]
MKSFNIRSLGLLLGLGLLAAGLAAQAPDSSDVLQDVLRMQREMPKPDTIFRSGHTAPRIIENYLSKTENGFVIQLPKAGLTPSPTVYKNYLYVSGGFGSKEFYAFDAHTGDTLWAINLDDDGPSAAVVQDDIVVFNTESCTIFACDAMSGAMLWSYFLGDPLMSTPTIAQGMVFTAYPASRGIIGLPPAGTHPGNIVQQQKLQEPSPPADAPPQQGRIWGTHVLIAMDLLTGKIIWQKWIDGDVMSAPVAEGDELYVATFPGTFYKFDLHTGEVLTAKALRATSAPVVVGEEVYMSQRTESEGEAVAEAISVMHRSAAKPVRQYAKKAAPYLDARVQQQSSFKSLASDYDAGNGFAAGAPANSGWQAASNNIGQSNVSSLQAFQGSRILHLNGKNYNTMGNELVCSEPQSGAIIWKQNISGELEAEGGFLGTPPLSVDDKIIIATLQGDILILDAQSGQELKRYATGEQIRYQPV